MAVRISVCAAGLATMLGMVACTDDGGTTIQVVQAPCTVPVEDRTPTDIAYRMRYLRIQEENSIINDTGEPAPLPTGHCNVSVPVYSVGSIDGSAVINCDNSALSKDMARAVAAASPFAVPRGTSKFDGQINVDQTEPGVAGQ